MKKVLLFAAVVLVPLSLIGGRAFGAQAPPHCEPLGNDAWHIVPAVGGDQQFPTEDACLQALNPTPTPTPTETQTTSPSPDPTPTEPTPTPTETQTTSPSPDPTATETGSNAACGIGTLTVTYKGGKRAFARYDGALPHCDTRFTVHRIRPRHDRVLTKVVLDGQTLRIWIQPRGKVIVEWVGPPSAGWKFRRA